MQELQYQNPTVQFYLPFGQAKGRSLNNLIKQKGKPKQPSPV